MGGKRKSAESISAEEIVDQGQEQPQPKYDPKTEKLIWKQASSALLTLLFYSILMFTLPFASFFGTKHLLQEHTQLPEFTITALSVIASVVTVWIIIACYAITGYFEKDVVIPSEKSSKKQK